MSSIRNDQRGRPEKRPVLTLETNASAKALGTAASARMSHGRARRKANFCCILSPLGGSTAILDSHSDHISKETKAWVAAQPEGCFSFIFTPKHGSWLNLIEGLFSKMARSMLRHIRVGSKAELKARIHAYFEAANRDPIIHRWTYKIAEAA